MDSISSSARLRPLRALVLSALTGVLGLGALTRLEGLPGEAAAGLAASGLVSTAAAALLLGARRRMRGFLWAYGAGAALRLGGLIALMAVSRGRGTAAQAALLLSYAAGAFVLTLVEAWPAADGKDS